MGYFGWVRHYFGWLGVSGALFWVGGDGALFWVKHFEWVGEGGDKRGWVGVSRGGCTV